MIAFLTLQTFQLKKVKKISTVVLSSISTIYYLFLNTGVIRASEYFTMIYLRTHYFEIILNICANTSSMQDLQY